MVHFLLPAHLEIVCPGCKKHHDKNWKPEFWRHEHYKVALCGCGYKIFIKQKHMSSGHY